MSGSPGAAGAGFVAAVSIVVRRDHEMLALRRSVDAEAGPGLWEVVSGRIEPDEAPLDAAMREVQEETGLTVAIDPRPVTAYVARRIDAPMIVVVYRADHVAGSVRTSAEHDDWAWMRPAAFAERSTLDQLVAAVQRAFALGPASASEARRGTDVR